MKNDIILYEIYNAITDPDEFVITARKHHPIAWVLGIILWSIIGIIQGVVLITTVIPHKLYLWALDWRYI